MDVVEQAVGVGPHPRSSALLKSDSAMIEAEGKSSIDAALARLKRGLMSKNEQAALTGYRQLYESGLSAIPEIEAELGRLDLKPPPPRVEVAATFAGLLSLLHDIDETASRAFMNRALQKSCNPVYKAILQATSSFRANDFRKSAFRSIGIWEHTDLDEAYQASQHVSSWLMELPPEDFAGVCRVYIIPQPAAADWLGQYMPVLSVVTLAWFTDVPPRSRLNSLINRVHRKTFFHEIGHHVHKHGFGQDPDHEREAEAYARRRIGRLPVALRAAASVVRAMHRRVLTQ